LAHLPEKDVMSSDGGLAGRAGVGERELSITLGRSRPYKKERDGRKKIREEGLSWSEKGIGDGEGTGSQPGIQLEKERRLKI